METCDILVRNGYLVTMDEARNRYPDGAVAISGGGIEAIGASEWHYNCMSRSLLHVVLAAPTRLRIDAQGVVDRLLVRFGALIDEARCRFNAHAGSMEKSSTARRTRR